MKKLVAILALLVSFASASMAQAAKPAPLPVPAAPEVTQPTDKEKLDVRQAELDFVQASSALTATQEYQTYMASKKAFDEAVAAVFKAHNTTNSESRLCDGPDNGLCKDVGPKDLAFRKIPVPEKPAAKPADKPVVPATK